jgi:hypothetical protein
MIDLFDGIAATMFTTTIKNTILCDGIESIAQTDANTVKEEKP